MQTANPIGARNRKTAEAVAAFWGKSLKDKNWYAMEDNGDTATIRIYDIIGWPFVDADTFVNELNRITASTIIVAINSPGGDVFDGTAIYNALKEHPAKIITRIDGIAASMASIIALAGDEITIAPNAYYMIHNAFGFVFGDYRDMQKAADLLDRINNNLAATYSQRTGKSMSDIRDMMDAETWLIGSELVDQGFADSVTQGDSNASAQFNLDMYQHAPEQYNAHAKRRAPESKREIEAGLRAMGYSRRAAASLAGIIHAAQSDSAADGQSDSADQQLMSSLQRLHNKLQAAL